MRHDPIAPRSELKALWRKSYGVGDALASESLRVFHYLYKDNQRETWHAHPHGQLLYSRRGVLRVITPSKIWTLAPMSALWLPPEIPHEFYAVGEVAMFSLYLDYSLAQTFWRSERVIPVNMLMHQLVLRLSTTNITMQEAPGVRESLTHLAIHEIRNAPELTHFVLPMPKDRRLLPICQHLIDSPDNNSTLNFWGDKVGASSRTLARLFISETGLSFVQWRQQLRLTEAVTRLAQQIPVGTIANDLGYHSVSAFVTLFKKHYGDTPQRYLRMQPLVE